MQAGPGMQQPPMLPYHQRPSFPQPTMQQGPPHQLQQLPLNPPAVAFNIVPPSHPPTGNAVCFLHFSKCLGVAIAKWS